MEHSEEFEASFRKEISGLLLRFNNPAIEESYKQHKLFERKLPTWFRWYIGIFIAFLLFRKLELLVFSFTSVQSSASYPYAEIMSFSSIFMCYVIEAVTIYCKKMAYFRGLILMTMHFYGITYQDYPSVCLRPGMNP